MKIQLLSDLHLEFEPYTPVATDADVVVLAGDIHTKARAVQWAEMQFKQPVVYVLGNHDYWGGGLERTVQKLKTQAAVKGQVHVLDAESLVLEGVRFYGAPFWTDFELTGSRAYAMQQARERMTDYRKIRHGAAFHKFTPETALRQHGQALLGLRKMLATPFEGKTVVVSHHAPSAVSLGPWNGQDPLNAAYASNLEHLMGEGIHAWFHGHVHHSLDYQVNGTRVVCNPRGYLPKEPNPDFNEGLVIEV